jgi:hypothetical protein
MAFHLLSSIGFFPEGPLQGKGYAIFTKFQGKKQYARALQNCKKPTKRA